MLGLYGEHCCRSKELWGWELEQLSVAPKHSSEQAMPTPSPSCPSCSIGLMAHFHRDVVVGRDLCRSTTPTSC